MEYKNSVELLGKLLHEIELYENLLDFRDGEKKNKDKIKIYDFVIKYEKHGYSLNEDSISIITIYHNDKEFICLDRAENCCNIIYEKNIKKALSLVVKLYSQISIAKGDRLIARYERDN